MLFQQLQGVVFAKIGNLSMWCSNVLFQDNNGIVVPDNDSVVSIDFTLTATETN
jgi:hypothetical protein